jgi:hypothetical protein
MALIHEKKINPAQIPLAIEYVNPMIAIVKNAAS